MFCVVVVRSWGSFYALICTADTHNSARHHVLQHFAQFFTPCLQKSAQPSPWWIMFTFNCIIILSVSHSTASSYSQCLSGLDFDRSLHNFALQLQHDLYQRTLSHTLHKHRRGTTPSNGRVDEPRTLILSGDVFVCSCIGRNDHYDKSREHMMRTWDDQRYMTNACNIEMSKSCGSISQFIWMVSFELEWCDLYKLRYWEIVLCMVILGCGGCCDV